MNFKMLHPADRIVMIMSRIYNSGMTTTSGGNISVRDDSGTVWITPSGKDKASLRREDIVQILPDGSVRGEFAPSSEYHFHLSIYMCRPDINSVIHAHPASLCSFSVLHKAPDTSLIPDAASICGDVAVAGYAVPGSSELGDIIADKFSKDHRSVILSNHGVVVGGSDLYEAFNILETLDYCAKLETNAKRISGDIRKISDKHIALYRLRTSDVLEDYEPDDMGTEGLESSREMCRLISRANSRGLFSCTSGTFSSKLSDGTVLVTPYAVDRKYISPSDLVRVSDGKKEKGKSPSRSVVLHDMIYSCDPGIKSIIIARPPKIMAFAVTDADFPAETMPESVFLLRHVKKYPFGSSFMQPGMLSKEINSESPVCIIENDCVIVCGKTPLQAYDRLEVLESTASAIIEARSIGGEIHSFGKNEIELIERSMSL
ncbi:MAG: class II aldolase/adducin family protein [Clostridia bacterium]|nr:class II aldolase/adducin family protein [Clostridia bacterium]